MIRYGIIRKKVFGQCIQCPNNRTPVRTADFTHEEVVETIRKFKRIHPAKYEIVFIQYRDSNISKPGNTGENKKNYNYYKIRFLN